MEETHSLPSSSNNIPEPETLVEHSHDNNEDDSEIAPRRSKRQRIAKSVTDDFTIYVVDDTPTSILEAYASPNVEYWKDVVHSEMDSITSNGT